MELTATSNKGAINYWGAGAAFINDGTVNATTAVLAYAGAAQVMPRINTLSSGTSQTA